MSALTSARNTLEVCANALTFTYSLEAAGQIYAGGLVARNSDGKAAAASDTANMIVLGRAEKTVATGETAIARMGVFIYENGTSTEALSGADIGKICYVLDDQTVGKAGGTNKVVAGRVLNVTDEGVYVELGAYPQHTHAISDVTGLQTALDGKADKTE